MFFYMTGCQDVNFSGIPSFDCAEAAGVEGVSCDPAEGDAEAGFGDGLGGMGGLGGPGGDYGNGGFGGGSGGTNISGRFLNRVHIRTRLGRVKYFICGGLFPFHEGGAGIYWKTVYQFFK